MITERQEKLLDFLIKEYISTAEPVSSKALKKSACLDVCGATIRNDLQVLTKEGYIEQPHTSAGRIPTRKAYRYFVSLRDISQRETEKEKQFDNSSCFGFKSSSQKNPILPKSPLFNRKKRLFKRA